MAVIPSDHRELDSHGSPQAPAGQTTTSSSCYFSGSLESRVLKGPVSTPCTERLLRSQVSSQVRFIHDRQVQMVVHHLWIRTAFWSRQLTRTGTPSPTAVNCRSPPALSIFVSAVRMEPGLTCVLRSGHCGHAMTVSH